MSLQLSPKRTAAIGQRLGTKLKHPLPPLRPLDNPSGQCSRGVTSTDSDNPGDPRHELDPPRDWRCLEDQSSGFSFRRMGRLCFSAKGTRGRAGSHLPRNSRPWPGQCPGLASARVPGSMPRRSRVVVVVVIKAGQRSPQRSFLRTRRMGRTTAAVLVAPIPSRMRALDLPTTDARRPEACDALSADPRQPHGQRVADSHPHR